MSATCPNSPNDPPKRVDATSALASAGFTLLELIVVLTLVSLLTVMAVPNLQRWYAAVTRTTERNAILNRLANLGRQAMLQRRAYLLVGGGAQDAVMKKPPSIAGPDDEDASAPGHVSPFEHHEPYRLDLPDGWTLHLSAPILVRANGVCLGGEVEVSYNGEPDVRLVLDPPYCHVDTDA